MESGTGTNNEPNKQTLEETTHFTPSPVIKNVLVTDGNGFLYVFIDLYQ